MEIGKGRTSTSQKLQPLPKSNAIKFSRIHPAIRYESLLKKAFQSPAYPGAVIGYCRLRYAA